ncbi:MAG: hypothetical protein GXO82_06615 [Chlorobi bacterium]|nr:hypothetical protein [Chlorobiota bacterium]
MARGEKIMFEIYRDITYSDEYRVVYFTELTERDRENEIQRAMKGEHVFDGYISDAGNLEARRAIDAVVGRLNSGEPFSRDNIERALEAYLVS